MAQYTGKYGIYFAVNGALTKSEREANAEYIRKSKTASGWSLPAICGLLGNMQQESGINPGRWQGGVVKDSKGYGLVQWTPSTNLRSWTKANGLDDLMDGQMAKIEWELVNGKQYFGTYEYPLTFKQFAACTASPVKAWSAAYYLARVFGRNYERSGAILSGGDAAEKSLNARGEAATAWYEFFAKEPVETKPNSGTGEAVSVSNQVDDFTETKGDIVENVNKIITYARAQVGKPYLLRASGPKAFDCSGLTKRAVQQVGYVWYHGASTQWFRGLGVKDAICKNLPSWLGYWEKSGTIDTLPMNEVAFLFNRDKTKKSIVMAHVGIYDGAGNVVQAGGQYKGVSNQPINKGRWSHWATLKAPTA
jgi:cell wall-associated NlpC family hydrolase